MLQEHKSKANSVSAIDDAFKGSGCKSKPGSCTLTTLFIILVVASLAIGVFHCFIGNVVQKDLQFGSAFQNVKEIYDGENSCIAIKFSNPKEALDREQIRKGMLIISNLEKYSKNVTWSFSAQVKILHHSTTINTGYMPVLHCGPIRQSAKLHLMEQDDPEESRKNRPLRTGDMQKVKFKFGFHPEFVEPGSTFFFRDGTTKGVGKIVDIL